MTCVISGVQEFYYNKDYHENTEEKKGETQGMKILHVSDIHFCKGYEKSLTGYKSVLYKMQSPLLPLDFCLDRVMKEVKDLDVLLISGDLSEDGTEDDYRHLHEYLEEKMGDIPIVVTLGNHDSKRGFRQGWLGEDGEEPYNVVQKIGNITVVGFDNSVQGNPNGEVSEEQMQWLEKTLDDHAGETVFLLIHHHLKDQQLSGVPYMPGSDELLDLLRRKGVSCIFCGHTHHNYAGVLRDIPYYTVDGMSFYADNRTDGAVRFQEKFGYGYYEFENGIITHHKTETFATGKVLADLFF